MKIALLWAKHGAEDGTRTHDLLVTNELLYQLSYFGNLPKYYTKRDGTIVDNDMATPKKYFHDHVVLLLLSVDAFLTLLASAFVLLRLSSGHGNGYIVQCRDCSNPLAINKFTTGSVAELLSFIAFAFLVLAVHTVLSMRAYHIHRQLAITILGLGILLLVLTIIISNALLMLR